MDLKANTAFMELMDIRGSHPEEHEVTITGADPFFASPFKIGETLAGALAARAVAANDLWELRTGRRQKIEVDVNAAAATALGGGSMTQRKNEHGVYEGIPATPELEHMVSLTQPWEAKNGRWFLPHFNLPHLEKKVLDVLGCEGTPEAVREAVRRWTAEDLDKAIADVNATGGIVFTPEEWLAHPHGKHLAAMPVVQIKKVGDSKPELLSPGKEPLSGIRVLELTRILAGPTAGISMAEHGADVLMVTSPELPQVHHFVRDTSHGKRSCYLDYTDPAQAAQLKALVREADVFIEGYRPKRMDAHGFGVEELVKERPGLIYVSIDCFGPGGVYSDRAGWDQVAQAVTGMAYTQGQYMKAGQPKLTPVYCCDFLTGFLGAFGAMVALRRRALEGGSYHIHVSLCQAAMLFQRQGLYEGPLEQAPGKLTDEEFEKYAICDDDTIYGDLKSLGPVIRMSETMPKWHGTTPQLGSSKPGWL